jgi:hypothetical protein
MRSSEDILLRRKSKNIIICPSGKLSRLKKLKKERDNNTKKEKKEKES